MQVIIHFLEQEGMSLSNNVKIEYKCYIDLNASNNSSSGIRGYVIVKQCIDP